MVESFTIIIIIVTATKLYLCASSKFIDLILVRKVEFTIQTIFHLDPP